VHEIFANKRRFITVREKTQTGPVNTTFMKHFGFMTAVNWISWPILYSAGTLWSRFPI